MRVFCLVLTLVWAAQALQVPFLDKNIQRNSSTVFTRYLEVPNNIRDVRCLLSQGDTLVPVIGIQKSRSLFVSKRRGLFAAGVYPGVEYKLINITVPSTSTATTSSARNEVFTLQGLLGREFRNGTTTGSSNSVTPASLLPDMNNNNNNMISEEEEGIVELTVAPAYPLIPVLEREWPVRHRHNLAHI